MTTLTNKTNLSGHSESRRGAAISTLLVLYLTLSIITVFIHNIIVDRPFHKNRVELHRQVIANQAPSPIQYRIFVYYIAEGLIRLGLKFEEAYWLIRVVFVFLSALLFHLFMKKWFEDTLCLCGTLFMFAVLPLTYWGYYMQPTDSVNLFFFIIAYWLIREKKDLLLSPLLFAATFNREAPVILPLVFLFYRYDELPLKELLIKFFVYCFSAGIVYFGLPKIFGIHDAYEEVFVLWRNLRNYRAFLYPALLFSVFLFLPWKEFAARPKFLRRAALLIPFFLLMHYLITLPMETRLFLPLFPIVIPLGLMTLFNVKTDDDKVTALKKETSFGVFQSAIIRNTKLVYICLFIFFLALLRVYYVYMEKTYMKDFQKKREVNYLLSEGDLLMKKGDYEGAEKLYNKIISKDPKNENAHLALGIIHTYYIKNSAKAIYYLQKTLEINPNHPQSEKIQQEIKRLKKLN